MHPSDPSFVCHSVISTNSNAGSPTIVNSIGCARSKHKNRAPTLPPEVYGCYRFLQKESNRMLPALLLPFCIAEAVQPECKTFEIFDNVFNIAILLKKIYILTHLFRVAVVQEHNWPWVSSDAHIPPINIRGQCHTVVGVHHVPPPCSPPPVCLNDLQRKNQSQNTPDSVEHRSKATSRHGVMMDPEILWIISGTMSITD